MVKNLFIKVQFQLKKMNSYANKNLLRSAAETVWKRKLLILFVCLAVVISGMTVTLLMTPKFDATMSLLISRERNESQISSGENRTELIQSIISDEEFNSELELIKSNEVIAGVVQELDLINDRKPQKDKGYGVWREKVTVFIKSLIGKNETENATPEDIEQAINRVARNLDVTPTKKSRIIKITYIDTDAQRAKKVLEKLYEKYAERHIELENKPEVTQIFNEQTENFNQKLNNATETLKRFDTANGLTGAQIGMQRELLLRQLYDSQNNLNITRTEMVENEKRISFLKKQISEQPEQLQTGTVQKYVTALDNMKDSLVKLKQERALILQKYQPQSRFVRDIEDKIKLLEKNIAEESAQPPQEKSFALNDLRRRLIGELYSAQTSFATLKEREKKLSETVAKTSAVITDLNRKTLERDKLERDKNINEEAYLLYEKKSRENRIKQELDKSSLLNFAVLDKPRTDGEQINPKPLLNLAVLSAIGLLAGFVGAVGIEKFNQKPDNTFNPADLILDIAEVELLLGIPVLANIPKITIPRKVKFFGLPQKFLPAPKPVKVIKRILPANRKTG